MNPAKTKLLNAAIAGLFATGSLLALSIPTRAQAADECYGINSCKGKGDCGGKGYSCAGNNECKGKGWLTIPKAVCERIEGASLTPPTDTPQKAGKKATKKS